jgi:tRNA G46 methylase TrmB
VKHNIAKEVTSNQASIHPKLACVAHKHKEFLKYRAPISASTDRILKATQDAIQKLAKPVIMDCGCGTGESSIQLGKTLSDHTILAIDKSAHRLNKVNKRSLLPENVFFLRANLPEVWTFAYKHKWNIKKQYLLYPNPWPKQAQLMRRWHAHPVMPYLISLSKHIELRTNWKTYALEFAWAMEYFLGEKATVKNWLPNTPISNFEKKYTESGHSLYKVEIVKKTCQIKQN